MLIVGPDLGSYITTYDSPLKQLVHHFDGFVCFDDGSDVDVMFMM